MWWLNLRASNTEPLLRLNVEAADEATMAGCGTMSLALWSEEKADGRATTGAQIEPWLREILRCPACRWSSPTPPADDGPELHCTNAECGLQYRIDDGVPVLLVDEARKPA